MAKTRGSNHSTKPIVAKNERLVTTLLGKYWCAFPRSWDNRHRYQGGGRCAPPFPERKRHQPFVFDQTRAPSEATAPKAVTTPPPHAPSERSEQWRPTPPHPPRLRIASPKTQGSPGVPLSDSAGAAAARETAGGGFPGGGHAPRTSEGERRGFPVGVKVSRAQPEARPHNVLPAHKKRLTRRVEEV